ncbi:MAG: hypothetical protein CYPHOPRED_005745 [Cyphobasidiales sp. Tagirdzhanova-0007]|nr:MAG: hypothetical protein CYPHOPRED_005745 [Cyphobasidiales sp. Tagirdzhanova-0007]
MTSRFRAFVAARPRLHRSLQLLTWAPVAFFANQHIAGVIAIEGRSMQPTFNPDASMLHEDVVFVNRFVKITQNWRVGDIVTFWAPGVNSFVLVTKRIIALEGDIVRTLHPWKDKTVRVPQGHAWVEGDEPIRSRDSNTFGPLPLGLVDGRIDAVLWPHWRFRRIHRSMPEAAEKRVIHHRNNAMKTED